MLFHLLQTFLDAISSSTSVVLPLTRDQIVIDSVQRKLHLLSLSPVIKYHFTNNGRSAICRRRVHKWQR